MPRLCPCKRHSLKRTAINQKARRAGLSHNRRRFSTDAIPHLLSGARPKRVLSGGCFVRWISMQLESETFRLHHAI